VQLTKQFVVFRRQPVSITSDDVALTEPPISEEDKKEKRIAVVEIFGPTFQGEGPLAGSKTMFVRFGGCDFRCKMCDSLHAVIPSAVKRNAQYLTAGEISDALVALRLESNTPWVTLSGGNPCMWKLDQLISFLHGSRFAVAVETQGTIWQDWLLKCQMVVISPKSPGMGEKFDPEKFMNMVERLWEKSVPLAVKVVVFSQQDIDFAFEVWDIMQKSGKCPVGQNGLLFLSLGNSYPPVLTEEMELVNNPTLTGNDPYDPEPGKDHRIRLLENYRVLMEDVLQDPRMPFFRFLPQLHVLTYSNEAER
jgi:7-carboxy-7-deazaguanine synthase